MKTVFLCLGLLVAGCASSGLVYEPAPQERLDASEAVRFSGEIVPYEIGFSGVYCFDGNAVRLAVLSDASTTLLDMRVDAQKAAVYYHAPKLPHRVEASFAGLARTYFFTKCPPEQISYEDKSLRAVFDVRTQGGICR